MFRLLLITTVAPIIVWGITNPDKCENGSPLPLAVRIEGCFPCSPCHLFYRRETLIEIDFIAPTILQYPQLAFYLDFMGELLGGLQEESICNDMSGRQCPIDKGDRVTYTFYFPDNFYIWGSDYATIPFNMTLSLEEGETLIACFKFPILISEYIG